MNLFSIALAEAWGSEKIEMMYIIMIYEHNTFNKIKNIERNSEFKFYFWEHSFLSKKMQSEAVWLEQTVSCPSGGSNIFDINTLKMSLTVCCPPRVHLLVRRTCHLYWQNDIWFCFFFSVSLLLSQLEKKLLVIKLLW